MILREERPTAKLGKALKAVRGGGVVSGGGMGKGKGEETEMEEIGGAAGESDCVFHLSGRD